MLWSCCVRRLTYIKFKIQNPNGSIALTHHDTGESSARYEYPPDAVRQTAAVYGVDLRYRLYIVAPILTVL